MKKDEIMKRYLDLDKNSFKKFLKNFEFLFKVIKNSAGELDLRLRTNYFNLYYKGNSLAKVIVRNNDRFEAEIHHKFLKSKNSENFLSEDKRFTELDVKNDYVCFGLDPQLLHAFFSKKNLNRLYNNISAVGYSEEMTFEQMLITDNLNRDDLFIIDRQVTETSLRGKRADLLALRQVRGDQYSFLIIEVKLGKNPELKRDVGDQLTSYTTHIYENFEDWKKSYEKTYEQMKQMSIWEKPAFEKIQIIKQAKGVEGIVVVGGYSGIARKSVQVLQDSYPKLSVKICENLL